MVTILQAGFVFVSSYMMHIWGFFTFFGILFGLVAGLNFMVSAVECNKYFLGKKMYDWFWIRHIYFWYVLL